MKRKEIEFNAEDLVSSVEALARHAAGKEKRLLDLVRKKPNILQDA